VQITNFFFDCVKKSVEPTDIFSMSRQYRETNPSEFCFSKNLSARFVSSHLISGSNSLLHVAISSLQILDDSGASSVFARGIDYACVGPK